MPWLCWAGADAGSAQALLGSGLAPDDADTDTLSDWANSDDSCLGDDEGAEGRRTGAQTCASRVRRNG